MAFAQGRQSQVPETRGDAEGDGGRQIPVGDDHAVAEASLSGLPVEEYLCARIRRAEQALVAHHESVLRRHGLTLTQYGVLLTLRRRGGLSGAQLARSTAVTQQTMGAVLAGLEKKQLLSRAESPHHAKVQIASLTEAGSRTVDAAHREVVELERSLSHAFGYEEYRAVCDLLERATSVLIAQTTR